MSGVLGPDDEILAIRTPEEEESTLSAGFGVLPNIQTEEGRLNSFLTRFRVSKERFASFPADDLSPLSPEVLAHAGTPEQRACHLRARPDLLFFLL